VREIMTKELVRCDPGAPVADVAKLMVDRNCGEVLVCDGLYLLGVITDRDIVCRGVAPRLNLDSLTARDVMTSRPLVTVKETQTIAEAVEQLGRGAFRRVPVVDVDGHIVGILSQVDVASRSSESDAGHILARTRAPRQMTH
jgi:CBS domain-containing protein